MAENLGSGKPLVAVNIREVCGKPLAYPANDRAELIAKIAGVKSLNKRLIELAGELGFNVADIYGRPLEVVS